MGNLGFDVTEESLQQLFAEHGQVESASIARDRDTQRSKGFAFVEMPSGEEAQAAITALNGKELEQRALTVNEARPREDRGFGNKGGFRPNFRSNNRSNNNQRPGKKGPAKRNRKQRR